MGRIQQGIKLEIPHEPGNFLVFDDLKGKHLDEAERVQTRQAMELVAILPEGFDLARLSEMKRDRSSEEQAASDATQQSHDDSTLLKYGCVGWEGSEYEDAAFDADLLDAETREWALSVIRERNIRPTQAESDSGPS